MATDRFFFVVRLGLTGDLCRLFLSLSLVLILLLLCLFLVGLELVALVPEVAVALGFGVVLFAVCALFVPILGPCLALSFRIRGLVGLRVLTVLLLGGEIHEMLVDVIIGQVALGLKVVHDVLHGLREGIEEEGGLDGGGIEEALAIVW